MGKGELRKNQKGGMESPASDYIPITASDTENLPWHCRGISFATAGALSIVTPKGKTRIIPDGALAAGIIHPIRAKRINATGTGASDIVVYGP